MGHFSPRSRPPVVRKRLYSSILKDRLTKIFLLSPAWLGGRRALLLLRPEAAFPLACRLRRSGLPLGEAFTFASGLYFRGKLAYAERFAAGPGGAVRVITTQRGLASPAALVTAEELRSFGEVAIDAAEPRFHLPLRRDAAALARRLLPDGCAVLLGSIATPKYREILLECFGDRLLFPAAFVGRGDLSRGGLLLRSAQTGAELPYLRVRGAGFRGRRAPRLGGS